jgi:O-antigen/teichoic acid export membrane protein
MMTVRKCINVEFFFVFMTQLVAAVTPLILMKILTFYLSEAVYGEYFLVTSVVAFCIGLPFNGLNQAFYRYISVKKDSMEKLSFLMSSAALYAAFLIVYLCVSIFVFFFLGSEDVKQLVFPAYIFMCGQVAFYIALYWSNGNRRRIKAFVISGSNLALTSVLLLLLFQGGRSDAGPEVLRALFFIIGAGNLFVVFCSSLPGLGGLLKVRWKAEKKDVINLLGFCFPLVLTSSSGWLRIMAARWYLNFYVDKVSVAIFSVLSAIAMIAPRFFQSTVVSYITPIYYLKYDDGEEIANRYLLGVLGWSCLLAFFSSIFLGEFSALVIKLFASDAYIEYSWSLPWMFFSMFMNSISGIAALKLFAQKRTSRLIFPNVSLDIISLIVGLVSIKWWGLTGAVVGFVMMNLLFSSVIFKVSDVFLGCKFRFKRR